MLQGDEHDGGERDHPEQHIAIGWTRGKVARPVAWVDEAHSNEQPWSDIFDDVEGAECLRFSLIAQYLK